MAKTVNEELRDALLRRQTYLLRYSGNVRDRMLAVLARTEGDIAEKIRAKLVGNAGLTTQVELRRLQSLIEQIRRIREPAWKEANGILRDEMVRLSMAEAVSIQSTVTLLLPVVITTSMPSARLLRSIALSRPFQGAVLGEWAAGMQAADLRVMHNAIQLGMTAGEDMRTIARRVVGTASAKGADGVLEMTRRQVQSVVRTAVQHVTNHSRTTWFLENSDVVAQEYFVATLDSRTTPVCRANDGKTFPMGKGPIPPLHFNCRSLRVAALDQERLGQRPAKPYTENQLAREYAKKNKLGDVRSRDNLPHGQKGKFDTWRRARVRELIGRVPAETTYQEWIRGQSQSFQNDTLGVTRAKLFRDGGLTLDKFVDVNGKEITLEQLAKKEREAFIAAGLDPKGF